MSLYDYQQSKKIMAEGYSFYPLIMAAVRGADDTNTAKIKMAWPELYEEVKARYNAPGGILRTDCDSDGCFTMPDGECVSPYPCIHSAPEIALPGGVRHD